MINIDTEGIVNQYEPKRKNAYKTYLICLILGIVLMLGGIPLFFLWTNIVWIVMGFILFAIGIVLIGVALAKKSSFTKRFLNDVSSTVFAEVFPDHNYRPRSGMDLSEILYPGFFVYPDKWETNDLMVASYKDIPFRMSYYNLQKEQRHTDSKGNTTYTYVTYAEGRMMRFRFSKNFRSIVKVLEKSRGTIFSEKGLEQCETEFIAFNQKFAVFASDELTVFYILTPQIQEKMLELEKTFNGHLYMAFINNELYVSMNSTGKNIYKFNFSKPLTVEGLRDIISVIILPATFIDLLDIDDRKFSSDSLSL